MSTGVARVMSIVKAQGEAIDRDYKRDGAPRAHAAWVLLFATIAIVSPKLIGSPESFADSAFLTGLTAKWPWPDSHPQMFWALWKGVHFGLLPWVCIRFVLRSDFRSHGFRFPEQRGAWKIVALALLVMVPITLLAARNPAFAATYPKCPGAGESLRHLVAWELAYAFQFLMVEVFYRGFLLFALARSMGWLSIFVMVLPYAIIHMQKPFAECAGSIVTGIALGAFALRTRSIAGGVVVHSCVALCMDLGALQTKGELALLFK